MAEIRIAEIAAIPRGEGRNVQVEGVSIAVFHTQDGEVFATQTYCPHRKGPLADGLLGGHSVVCPLHDRIFDLKTGCGLSHEQHEITTYPVRVESGAILVSREVLAAMPQPAEIE